MADLTPAQESAVLRGFALAFCAAPIRAGEPPERAAADVVASLSAERSDA